MVLVLSCEASGKGARVLFCPVALNLNPEEARDQGSQLVSPKLAVGLGREARPPANRVSLPCLPPARKTKGTYCGMSSASYFPGSLEDGS